MSWRRGATTGFHPNQIIDQLQVACEVRPDDDRVDCQASSQSPLKSATVCAGKRIESTRCLMDPGQLESITRLTLSHVKQTTQIAFARISSVGQNREFSDFSREWFVHYQG